MDTTIQIDCEVRKRLKIAAAKDGRTMRAFIDLLLVEHEIARGNQQHL